MNEIVFWIKSTTFHKHNEGQRVSPNRTVLGAADMLQICSKSDADLFVCRKEEFMFAGVCSQLQSFCEHDSFLRHTCCKHMSAGRLQNHSSFSRDKKIFAGCLQETLNNSEMFTGNLRELSTIKIVCRNLAEILNKHIFNFESFQCCLKMIKSNVL